MHALRGSLSNIPGALSNIISSLPTSPASLLGRQQAAICAATDPSSPPSSVSGDEFSERSHAIPAALITEEWQLILGQNASVDELANAIDRCKELVIGTDECSSERKWLVRHLVELRFRLKEIEDMIEDPQSAEPNTTVILGHHFVPGTVKNVAAPRRQYCDHCSGIIWSVVQASFVCSDCHYCAHHKCMPNIVRVCAHVIASERKQPVEDISPELGLSVQAYKCAECAIPMNFKGTWIEARLCDYTGLYFCPTCHWNDTATIPARVVHNWDFSRRKVARSSLQELNLIQERAVINLKERNPRLFIYVENLSLVQKLRENLYHMKQYLTECRLANATKLFNQQIGNRRHLVQSSLLYSMADLIAVESGSILEFLNKAYHAFDTHIRLCDVCTGKGYLCEICGNDEVIFPFDDGAIQCEKDKCAAMFHRACLIRKNMKCTKCVRLEMRRAQQQLAIAEETE